MQPNTNHPLPQEPQATSPSPVQGIAPIISPAVDSAVSNLTKTGAVFSDINPVVENSGAGGESANPIAGTAAPHSGTIHEQAHKDVALDGMLSQVSSNIKAAPSAGPAAIQKKKRGLFGGGKAKAPHPAAASHGPTRSPVANPIHRAAARPKKPILPIAIAVIAAIGLGLAAIMAF